MRVAARLIGATLLACVALALSAHVQPMRGLTAAPVLVRVYDAIFDARIDEVSTLVATTCPPAPADACLVLEAVAVWWEIQLDPFNTVRDALFQSRVDAAIDATTAWTLRDPERAEAWFYLGGAYGAKAQWRVLRGERLTAARDGKRIKNALERALASSRPWPDRRLFRHRSLPLLRGCGAQGAQDPAVPTAAARRRPR